MSLTGQFVKISSYAIGDSWIRQCSLKCEIPCIGRR